MASGLTHPLKWPPGVRRTDPARREKGQFKTDESKAAENVRRSLRAFSTDSGKPLENINATANRPGGGDFLNPTTSGPKDPGVAIWFRWDGLDVCFAVDRYTTVAANLQAIHHIVEARRVELRHGTFAMARASFEGFRALPAPAGETWWQVLGVKEDDPPNVIHAAYRQKSKDNQHGDSGQARLNMARDTGMRERGGG